MKPKKHEKKKTVRKNPSSVESAPPVVEQDAQDALHPLSDLLEKQGISLKLEALEADRLRERGVKLVKGDSGVFVPARDKAKAEAILAQDAKLIREAAKQKTRSNPVDEDDEEMLTPHDAEEDEEDLDDDDDSDEDEDELDDEDEDE